MPDSRPLPVIGARCHELRISDGGVTWRIIYHLDEDAVVILDVFHKKTRALPHRVVQRARQRLQRYRDTVGDLEA